MSLSASFCLFPSDLSSFYYFFIGVSDLLVNPPFEFLILIICPLALEFLFLLSSSLPTLSILSFSSLNMWGILVLKAVSENFWYLCIPYVCLRPMSESLWVCFCCSYFIDFFLFHRLLSLCSQLYCWCMKNSRDNINPRIMLSSSRYDYIYFWEFQVILIWSGIEVIQSSTSVFEVSLFPFSFIPNEAWGWWRVSVWFPGLPIPSLGPDLQFLSSWSPECVRSFAQLLCPAAFYPGIGRCLQARVRVLQTSGLPSWVSFFPQILLSYLLLPWSF